MDGEAADPVAWLRAVIEEDLGSERERMTALEPGVPREGDYWFSKARDHVADCEAKLAVIDACAELLPPDPGDLDEHYQDGRDPDEQMRDEALADLAGDILALLAGGYRHREGWAGHWACPGCGKAIREVPVGHSWAISMQDGTWSCSDPRGKPVSPEEFMRGA